MKYLRFVMIGLAFVFLIYVFFVIYQNRTQDNVQDNSIPTNQTKTSKQQWETKTNDQSAVIVAVTPIDISSQSKEWKFDIVMDTHSVELDQDMTKGAVLIDDFGKEYSPSDGRGRRQEATIVKEYWCLAPSIHSLNLSNSRLKM